MINGLPTPLNLNATASFLQNSGLRINPVQQSYIGTSSSISSYATRGSIYTNTILDKLGLATALAYGKIGTDPSTQITQANYNALISIGSTSVPALGNSKPSTYTNSYTGEITKHGWLRLIALQAYQEFHVNGNSLYSDFFNTFSTCNSFLKNRNQLINGYNVSTKFLKSNYSNMSDLITSDITGVSMATLYWGQDLIKLGRALDLTEIDNFGLPSVLLRTLYKNRALTPSLNIALISATSIQPEFTKLDLDNIISGITATVTQEKLLYGAYCVIQGNDLADICTLLNCQTQDLNTLADLLDVKKLFPSSYKTLTCPSYNTEPNLPTNSKTYYPIYANTEPNVGIFEDQGLRLVSILPTNIAYASDAFSFAMMQIKNIKFMNIEKFAQVVTNLENVADLNTGSGRYPISPDLAVVALSVIGKGSNDDNTYTMCDFFGSMTDLHYDFVTLQSYLKSLSIANLQTIYNNIYSLMTDVGPYNTQLATYISQANAEIVNIKNGATALTNNLNNLYNKFGTYLTKEQNARSEALPNLVDLTTTIQDTLSFMDQINDFAIQTQDKGPALVLESIADTTTMGGNSLIGSMREIRNSERLGLVGGTLDSGVDTKPLILPRLDGDTSGASPVDGYTPNSCVSDISIVTGTAVTPGSLAGSPEVRLIPPHLSIFNTGVKCSVMTPSEAINTVVANNCDCWN